MFHNPLSLASRLVEAGERTISQPSRRAPATQQGEGRGRGGEGEGGHMLEQRGGLQSHKSPPKLNTGSTWRGFLVIAASVAPPPPLIIISLSLSLSFCTRSHYSSSVMSSLHSIFSMPNNISMSSIHPSVSVRTVCPLMCTHFPIIDHTLPLWQSLNRI